MKNSSIYEFCKKIDMDIKTDFGGGSPVPKTFLMSYLIQNQNLKSYIEIGVYRGKSLFSSSYSIYKNNGKSYGIDPYMLENAKEKDVEENLINKIDDFLENTDFETLYRDVLAYKEKCGYGESIKIIREPSYDAIDYFIKNDIKADMIHIDGNHDTKFVNLDFTKYYDILEEGGFYVFDDINWDSVRTVYDEAKKQCPVIFECKWFGILLKEQPSIGRNIKIEKLSKRLCGIYEKVSDVFYKEDTVPLSDLNSQGLTVSKDYDLVIISGVFPHPLSGFSYAENVAILNEIPSSLVITTWQLVSLLGTETIDDLIIDFKQKHPELSKRLYKFNENLTLDTRLLYSIFLSTTFYSLLPIAERLKIPFIFTLYPGGGFVLNDKVSDDMLKKVFKSPFFKKVIVTQKVTKDYLLKKGFCNEKDIEFVFGIVTPIEKLSIEMKNKRHYGFEKETLDICFVAHKYTPFGEDKGYDVFVEAAKKISNLHDNICFHVVGPWNENILDIGGIKNIRFYGSRNQDWFDEFYSDKDIILSPNINDKYFKGHFDGFPLGSQTEAALRKVAMFGTDPLKLNNGIFSDKKDFVFIEHDVSDIVCKIEYYYNNPHELKILCENGQAKAREVYSYDRQLRPRIQILNTALKNKSCKHINVTRIPVMHCFDNNYSIQAAASIYSMLLHANKSYDYILYVLSTDITWQNKAKLYYIVNRFTNAELEFIDMNNRFDGLLNKSLHGFYSKEVLYKLITPSIFPQHDKLIITDVDVIFLSDISESYFCFESPTEKLIAGIKHLCPSDSFLENYYYANYYKRFGKYSLNKLKICGGYLVYHLDNMRKNKIEDKFLAFLNKNVDYLPQLEQDVINFCLEDDQVKYLPLNYVVCTYIYNLFNNPDKLETDHYYNKDQIIDALKNPIQLHYATKEKPWNTSYCTKSEIWYDYVSKCGLLKEQMQKEAAQKTDEPELIDYCSNIDVLNCVESTEWEQQVMVSVLCCTYNHRKFIERTLEGILSQETDFYFEVIISDDASTDGTQDIISKFMKKHPNNIRSILRHKNVGIGWNYYEALKIVKGKYLAICDGDDFWINNHKLQEQIDYLECNDDYTICCSSFNIAGNDTNNTFYVNEYISKNYLLKDSYGFKDILNCRFIASCTAVMRWKLCGNVPEFIREYKIIDFQLMLIHAAFGKIKVMSDKIYSQYNVHNQSITQVNKTDVLIAEQKMIINEVNQFLDFKFDKTIQRFLNGEPEEKPPQPHCKEPLTIKTIIKICYMELVPELLKKLYRKIKKRILRDNNVVQKRKVEKFFTSLEKND